MVEAPLWPAPQPKKSTLVARWVLEQIRARRYPEGTKLPSEREIAQILRVSRPPVREALSALQIAGIVEIRPGDGTYVKSAAPVPETVDTTLSVLEEGESPFEVMQVRRILEEGGFGLPSRGPRRRTSLGLRGSWKNLGMSWNGGTWRPTSPSTAGSTSPWPRPPRTPCSTGCWSS